MAKVIDKINACVAAKRTFFSFEFFPPRTEEGVENLFERQERMASYGPVFCDITWGAGGSTADVTKDIAVRMQNEIGVETMMHLTCTNMQVEMLEDALREVKQHGLRNILALRGDPPKGQEKFTVVEGGFACALDLVKYIRKQFGDYFGITVAGYPEAHPDTIVDDPEQMEKNYWENIQYLKAKVDAGGEVIVTQLFYDVDIFIKFVKDCRSVGITVPILPGIMPIMTYNGFTKMTGFCKTRVPAAITEALNKIKDNEEAVKNYGVDLGVEMCRRLLDAGAPGLHMYTLNLEKSAVAILSRLGLIDSQRVPRNMPYRLAASSTSRATEVMRPVYWVNRPRSYLKRTSKWLSFPTARWAPPAEFAGLDGTNLMQRITSSGTKRDKAAAAWGTSLESAEDVAAVFAKYYGGEVALLPWSETDCSGGQAKSLGSKLAAMSRKGLLPVTALPALNGLESTDAAAGWGPSGGFIYQRPYLEFFASPEAFEKLLPKLQESKSVTYAAANAKGDLKTNMAAGSVSSITWAAFPGKEVMQPMVAEVGCFEVWAGEAFGLWSTEWGALYDGSDSAASKKVLENIRSSYWLVSVLDSNHVKGDLFALLGC